MAAIPTEPASQRGPPPTPLTSETFKPLLARLVETPEYFSTEDLTLALDHLFSPITTTNNETPPPLTSAGAAASPVQIGAFLAALHVHRIDRRPEMLAAAAAALRARALKADIEARETDFVVDIVGTGGDGQNTFNVSTTAAVVAAGAGARVCKVIPIILSFR